MSVRAHRVIKVRMADCESFNLNRDAKLAAFLSSSENIYDALAPDGTGILGVPVKTLKRAIKRARGLELSQAVADVLKKDVAFAEGRGDDLVDYFLF
ncbi:MAG: hypothetical protein HY673_20785 [Chloroflexi bacterium]|nr:hypothetical protein [Chloroflexota bacterium]